MNTNDLTEKLRSQYRRDNNLDPVRAIVGDAAGNIASTDGLGYVMVRVLSSNGLTFPIPVRAPTTRVALTPGLNVILENDAAGRPYIARVDGSGEAARGSGALQATQVSTSSRITQDSIETLAIHPTPTPSLSVKINAWNPIAGNTYYEFAGALVDLSSYVPSAGMQCYAALFVKSDYATTEVTTSTARSIADTPLGVTDVQQCLSAKNAGSIPVAALKLVGGQTAIAQNDIQADAKMLQQLVNIGDGGGGSLTVRDSSGTPSYSGTTTVQFVNGMLTQPSAGVVQYAPPSGGSSVTYPKRVTLWADEGNWSVPMVYEFNSSARYGLRTYQAAGYRVNGTYATWSFVLAAGTYTLAYLNTIDNDAGKLDIVVDGVTQGTIDPYNASGNIYNITATASIVIASDGYHTLKMIVNGKNPSSTGYFVYATKLWIYPSTD